jgi:hypothetical protein
MGTLKTYFLRDMPPKSDMEIGKCAYTKDNHDFRSTLFVHLKDVRIFHQLLILHGENLIETPEGKSNEDLSRLLVTLQEMALPKYNDGKISPKSFRHFVPIFLKDLQLFSGNIRRRFSRKKSQYLFPSFFFSTS